MGVVVHNLQEAVPLPEELAETASRAVARALALEGYGDAAEVSLVFVDDERIRELNRDYRGVDRATDVLAFPMHEEEPGSAPGEGPVLLLGDIVISLPTAARQAEACGHGLPYEVAYLAVHGALHLLGYDHKDEQEYARMRGKEKEILALLGLEAFEGEDELLEAARRAMENAYAPYSGIRVGAAVRTASGAVFTGCNVENASYGLTLCAERAAVAAAVAAGHRDVVAIAVVSDAEKVHSPCGACRQTLHEFNPDMLVIHTNPAGTHRYRLRELLPAAFSLR
ncbi:MAG TPA: rRNA maturation RNase YbeY [Peptococcaceae bacterium]|nr:rRNA maturation RNase YbeY [Peptococcaceae bacterium]